MGNKNNTGRGKKEKSKTNATKLRHAAGDGDLKTVQSGADFDAQDYVIRGGDGVVLCVLSVCWVCVVLCYFVIITDIKIFDMYVFFNERDDDYHYVSLN